jgi:hypothetical protein
VSSIVDPYLIVDEDHLEVWAAGADLAGIPGNTQFLDPSSATDRQWQLQRHA